MVPLGPPVWRVLNQVEPPEEGGIWRGQWESEMRDEEGWKGEIGVESRRE